VRQTFFLCPPHLLLSKIPFFIYLSKTLNLDPIRNFTSDRDSAHVISNDHPVIVPQDHIDRVSLAEIVAMKKIHHLLVSEHPLNCITFP